ncbi:MazG nucleotide pyrophosphohydrolase domain-containing protein [Paenibacillus kobensis]|uniref:MazG nucleotide pyrophosphohydrolase domain-containing protein n=1 Tax=Paenibacillus kobensis TaxID=59841 RepID=UPI001C3F9E0A|nr:MazG nucleotide pyrophosphohydrolase domain-containing protein [Paenibacillus kobensis]
MIERPIYPLTLAELQSYVKGRDYIPEAVNGYFLKLIEEVGELAEAMRKNVRQDSSGIKGTIEEELADVLYYTISLANVYAIDLELAFKQKDELNRMKWGQ